MFLYKLTELNIREPKRTTYAEVSFCVQPLILSILMRYVLHLCLPNKQKFPRTHLVAEHILLVGPFGLVCFEEILSNSIYPWFIVAYASIVLLLYTCQVCRLSWAPSEPASSVEHNHDVPESNSSDDLDLRTYRGLLYLATVMCIIGRDLNGFRIRFAKAHIFGTGLMDIGVGSFVILMGIIGPTARRHHSQWTEIRFCSEIKKASKICIILILIGVLKVRLVHLSHLKSSHQEYGTHWNVFISLGIIKILGTLTEVTVGKRIPPLLLGLIISIGFEVCLEKSLKTYVVNAPNDGFINGNRAGITQLPGLLAIYLWGVQIGRRLFIYRNGNNSRMKSFFFLMILAVTVCTITSLLKWFRLVEYESRRMSNFSYDCWMVCFNSSMLAECYAFRGIYEALSRKKDQKDSADSTLLVKIDRVGFQYFVIGNILTGCFRLLKSVIDIDTVSVAFIYLMFHISLTTVISHYLMRISHWFGAMGKLRICKTEQNSDSSVPKGTTRGCVCTFFSCIACWKLLFNRSSAVTETLPENKV